MRLEAFVFLSVFVFSLMTVIADQPTQQGRTGPWTKEQANEWYKQWEWLRGCNFTPSTAINQLEMWQADTFDPETIDRELGWAADIGMNCMRVYLHHAAWNADRDGFKKRVGQYLDIAEKHGIVTMIVFFDDCWNARFSVGKQPEPRPGIHNSGWLQDPGMILYEKPELMDLLEIYVKDILTTFRDDKRIFIWDLYNEPGNFNHRERSFDLVKKVFDWAWAVNPSQPLTIGAWNTDLYLEMVEFYVANSDIITYHNYMEKDSAVPTAIPHRELVENLKLHGRPMICTEYMARHFNSTFQEIMPFLKAENIGAINWGLVAGKTNTIFKWDEPLPEAAEPPLWFHDILRKDGTPYSQEEVDLIKSLTGKK